MQSLSALFMLKYLPFSMDKSCDETLNRGKAFRINNIIIALFEMKSGNQDP